MKSFQILSILLLVVFTLVCTIPASADNLYASIRGTVTDQTGAVIAGVKLTATNTATGISFSDTSNKDGNFSFLQLPVGDYKIKAEQSGFKAYQASGIHLDLDQVYNLNVKLAIGAVSEQIVVEANPVQVEQTDMQLGTTISGQTIVDMPLNGRNWTQLQQLEPGVIGTSDRFGGNNGGFSGNGAETQQNSFLINGNDSNDAALNTVLVVPSVDAIGEFRMVTSTINPEFGRNSGTIINAAIKNGTNAFHGDGYEFYRDTFLDAENYFEGQALPAPLGPSPFHRNTFGGTIGGPIIKNHAFFFFSYDATHQREPITGFGDTPVYSSAERTGDFSALLGTPSFFGNNQIPFAMYGDVNSTCRVSGGVPCDPTNANSTYANLFSTGVIPLVDGSGNPIDGNPLALKLMNQFVPSPNSGNNYVFNPVEIATSRQYIYRIDDKIRESDSLWFYSLYQTAPNTQSIPFVGASLPGFAEQNAAHTQQYAVSWSHTFSPTTLNELRIGYTRFNFSAVNPVDPINPTTYGFAITPQTTAGASIPVINIAGLFSIGFSSDGPQPRIQNTYNGVDNFSKVWGHHTIKAGVSVDRLQINNPFYNNLAGTYNFNGQGPYSSGIQGADFLLGIPDNYAQGSGSIVQARGTEVYAYAQDQFQVRPNLTITYGVGWDLEKPWVNLFGGGKILAAFRAGQQSTVFPFMPPGIVYPGDTGINKYGGMSVHYDLFAPRIGFAYSPGASRNWSIHGGIGLYYNRSEEELALQTLTNPPFALSSGGATALCGSPGFVNPFLGVQNSVTPCTAKVINGTINPFPFVAPKPGNTTFDPSVFYPIGFGLNTEDPKFTAPRSVNFNLTVERQLDKSTIISLAFVGNIGRHEEGAYNLNEAGQAPGVNPAAAAFGCISGLNLSNGNCPQTPIGGPPVAGATPLNIGQYGQPGVQATGYNSNYNSMQLVLNRHFSGGLQVLAAYTWSRYFDQTSSLENTGFNFPGINPFDPKQDYAPSANDAPQRFVVSYTYTLPFFKLTHRWKRLTDDWNISGVYTLQHGLPDALFDLYAGSLTCDVGGYSYYACPDLPSRTSTPLGIRNPRNPGNYWFNPAAFTTPLANLFAGTGNVGVLGTALRNPIYGPGLNYTDMALEKNIHIDESRYLQLRLETFNTFNHANFSNPITPGFNSEDASLADSGTFGQIFGVKAISTNGDGRVVQLGVKFYF